MTLSLPSEADWEYACRAGTATALCTGGIEIHGDGNAPSVDPIAWYSGNCGVGFELDNAIELTWVSDKQHAFARGGTHPVGRKQPNAWGLYDILGNVWEWCEDHWHATYEGAPADGSAWLDPDSTADAPRVVRGGSWGDYARVMRSAFREPLQPYYLSLGLRPAMKSA